MGNGGQLTPLGIRKRPVTFSCQLLDFRSCLASCWRRDQRTLRTPSACTDVYDRLNVTLTQQMRFLLLGQIHLMTQERHPSLMRYSTLFSENRKLESESKTSEALRRKVRNKKSP
ncbi:hypothetical protein Y1Q_0002112 [Alligator mississippiensis]|uniref:Uncharacterized protein n=1 Tax=Alligator mississippiensis TaxID=8496 RepID=A0A151MJ01_ALLMI|nr:hypothetical protein Y1Q_0002112 [Alligator mississippiensis]